MGALAAALLAELSDAGLDRLTELLAPRLAPRLAARFGPRDSEDAWLRYADQIATYINAPRSRVYALTSAAPFQLNATAAHCSPGDRTSTLCSGPVVRREREV
jgi:hypothetical protein